MNHVSHSQYSSTFSNNLLKSTVVRFTVQTKNSITNNYSQIISQIGLLLLLQLVNDKYYICPWCNNATNRWNMYNSFFKMLFSISLYNL